MDTARETLAGYLTANPDGYTVRDGTISTPGKFEGEPLYVPFYHGLAMDGGADESGELADGTAWDAFDVREDVARCAEVFPGDGPDPEWIVLYYRDSGFIDSDLATAEQFRQWVDLAECQRDGTDPSDL